MLSAFGYLRPDSADQDQVAAMRTALDVFCAAEGMSLEVTFIDTGASESQLIRPGWSALLEALGRRGGAAVVVVPGVEHLSAAPEPRAVMAAQLGDLGATLRVLPTEGGWAEGPLGTAMRGLGIVQIGDPGLVEPCSRLVLPQESVEAMRLGARLFTRVGQAAAVHGFTSGMGLSAPQLGVHRAALVVRPVGADPVMLFNPRVVAHSVETAEEYEGCLSFFDYRGLVRRPVGIEVEHQSTSGAYTVTVFEAAQARLVAHEIDHLMGLLYTDRMPAGMAPIPIQDYRSN